MPTSIKISTAVIFTINIRTICRTRIGNAASTSSIFTNFKLFFYTPVNSSVGITTNFTQSLPILVYR